MSYRESSPNGMRKLVFLLLSMVWFAPTRAAIAQTDAAFYEKNIRPLLASYCYECHSQASGVTEGNLALDSMALFARGGSRGPVVVPGNPDASLLLRAVKHLDPELQMPPDGDRLPDDALLALREWIVTGATLPRDQETMAGPARKLAWQPLPDVIEVPVGTSQWSAGPIDSFLQEKMHSEGLSVSDQSQPLTLLRRLTFDLVGLPPEPAQQSRYIERTDQVGSERATKELVDELISSPEFGVRWGRHWLDVARFAESSGKEANISFPYAWRYRDYVYDAFSADVPFDQLIQEQLAGDLLPYDDELQRSRLLIATGFLAIGPKNLDEMDARQFAADVIDEQIDSVSRVFLASSIACARCHDHKSDPYTMRDYYALAGVFGSTETYFGTGVSPANRVGGTPLELPRLPSNAIFHRSIPAERVKALEAEKAELKKERGRKGKDFTLRDALRVFWRTGAIDLQLEKVDQEGRALPLAMGVLEKPVVKNQPILLRGDVNRPSETIQRRFPKAFGSVSEISISSDASGRLEMARWLVDRRNPLTSRVIVNRIWAHLIGRGLVATVDDFGVSGSGASHAELLDYLSKELIRHDWSLKWLIREIVLTRAYQQSSQYDPQASEQDPDNQNLSRMAKRRLDAEAMRDAMLLASGELDRSRPPASLVGRVIGDRPIALVGLDKRLPRDLDESRHRSAYLPILRNRLPDVLDVFDFAEPSLVVGQRQSTNVPTQGLYLLNSAFVMDRAQAMAVVLGEQSNDPDEQVRMAFSRALGREPTVREQEAALPFLKSAGKSPVDQLSRLCHALFMTAEFRLLD